MTLVLKALAATAMIAILPLTASQAQSSSAADEEKANANVVQADADRDGALNHAEFGSLINLNANNNVGKARLIRRFDMYEAVFGRIDENGDGLVMPLEMKALAEQVRG